MMMSQNDMNTAGMIEALQWHLDHGADEMLLNESVDRTAIPEMPKVSKHIGGLSNAPQQMQNPIHQPAEATSPSKILNFQKGAPQEDIMGAAQAIEEAQKITETCASIDELKQAIADFSGLSVKKTASNMVFSDGDAKADIMIIGEAPGADEDVQGKPFVGESGQLLDRILACIDLDRRSEDVKKAVYLSNVLNWRPPGNRTPTASEMNISRPFIERHIALVQPKAIIVCGGVAAKTLLRSDATISKLRGQFHDYQAPEGDVIPLLVTYHPTYLLRTPAQKKAVWADMLMFQEKILVE